MSESSFQSGMDNRPAVPLLTVALSTFAITSVVLVLVTILPTWIPAMAQSATGENIKVYWYLSRGSAVVAYLLLWGSMVLGLLMTNKMARYWPGAPAAYDLHEYVSLLGLGFVLFHALILMGDSYIQLDLLQILVPFGSVNFKPIQVALGQYGFYLWGLLVGTFYIRKKLGMKTWRLIHFASFVSFLFAMLHGITSGTDTSAGWMQTIYWTSAGSLLFLTVYRVLMAASNKLFPAERTRSPGV